MTDSCYDGYDLTPDAEARRQAVVQKILGRKRSISTPTKSSYAYSKTPQYKCERHCRRADTKYAHELRAANASLAAEIRHRQLDDSWGRLLLG